MAGSKPSDSRLRKMIAEAIADAHDEEEEAMGFTGMIQQKVSCPFAARIAGEEVWIPGFVEGEGNDLMALCERNGREHRVPLQAIEWAGKPPKGSGWIEAYRLWRRRL